MLKLKKFLLVGEEAGDTLVEVTIALTILALVLAGGTSIATLAFQMGQTAQDRTQISEAAQEQMEALRSFRDNNSWAVFESGQPGLNGIDTMPTTGFHMALVNGATTEWEPVPGSLVATAGSGLTAPGATMSIVTNTPVADRGCGYDFVLAYSFIPPGGNSLSLDTNQIKTRLANLKYSPGLGAAVCP